MFFLDKIFGAVLLFLLLLPGYYLFKAFREMLGEVPTRPKHRALFALLLIAHVLGIALIAFSFCLVIYSIE